MTLARLGLSLDTLANWIVSKDSDYTERHALTATIGGLLQGLPEAAANDLIHMVLGEAESRRWPPERVARFMTLARLAKDTWDIVACCGGEVERAYWAQVPAFWLAGEGSEPELPLRHLLKVDRPRTALKICQHVLEKVDPNLLADALEQVLQGKEPDGPLLDSWQIGQIIERLEASATLERERLVRLEFWCLPLFGYRGEQKAKTLYVTLMSDPALFCELICILFKPRHRENEEPPNEQLQAAARVAWRVLFACPILPGTQLDGTLNESLFYSFIDRVRSLCREKDRLEVCDDTLGQILARSPDGQDGIWPFEPARNVLDRPELEHMRRGFVIGTLNVRGVTSRAPDEGGSQERELAAEYRSHADALRASYPYLAAALDEIAKSYEQQASREDLDAQLRLEGNW